MLCDNEECDWYEFSVPGNIHYAYVGRAAGFKELEIHGGASYAEMDDPTNPSAIVYPIAPVGKEGYGITLPSDAQPHHFNLNWWKSLLDDPQDYAAIELGLDLYRTYGKHIPMEGFKQVLGRYKSRLAKGVSPSSPCYNSLYPYPEGYFDGAGQ